jgi:hypothetical protein
MNPSPSFQFEEPLHRNALEVQVQSQSMPSALAWHIAAEIVRRPAPAARSSFCST